MLADDDNALADRDPALPVLRQLLDDEAALHLFRATMPEASLTAVRLTYLRYKPETSVLAAFDAQSANGRRQFHATAYRVDAIAKLEKLAARSIAAPIVDREQGLAIWPFPLDGEIDSLCSAAREDERRHLLARIAPRWEPTGAAEWSPLRYKPQRRFVARVVGDDGRPAVLRLYAPSEYARARRAAKSAPPTAVGVVPRVIGRSDRHSAILMEWVAGVSLAEMERREFAAAEVDLAQAWRAAGATVAQFHNLGLIKLPTRNSAQEASELLQSAADLARLCPELATDAAAIVDRCVDVLSQGTFGQTAIHGDLHVGQLVFGGDDARLIDIDAAAIGDAAFDLGSLRASLQAHAAASGTDASLSADGDALWDEFLRGYGMWASMPDAQMIAAATAAAWLRRAQEPFRQRQPQWRAAAAAALCRAQDVLSAAETGRVRTASAGSLKSSNASLRALAAADVATANLPAEDALRQDAALAHATAAVDPAYAAQFIEPLVRAHFGDNSLRLVAIRVVRHKPGRRCVVEYECQGAGTVPVRSVLGKIHAKSRHRESYQRQRALMEAGFGRSSPDEILVPAPVGYVDECQMWLQECVPGFDGWTALGGTQGARVAAQVVEAIAKLQSAPLQLARTHTLEDEIELLADRLARAAACRPDLRERIEHVTDECRRRAFRLAPIPVVPAHRDFYPDQIRIDGDRLYILDHDLLCLSDPRLDVANFLGHLDEMVIRGKGRFEKLPAECKKLGARTLGIARDAMADSFQKFMPRIDWDDVEFLAIVTLARHVHLSSQIAGRGHTTEAVLDACEIKLALSIHGTTQATGGRSR